MKGDRRQHGAIKCYDINQPLLAQERYKKMVDSATATRLFTKAINQSKCTGKCQKGRCSTSGHHHKHAVCKSRDKMKGAMKIRSIDPRNESTKYFVGNSASRALAYLAHEEGYNDNDDYDYDYQGRVLEETYNYGYAYDANNHDDDHHIYDHDHVDDTHAIDLCTPFAIGIGIVVDEVENDVDIDYDNHKIDDDDDDDDDDDEDDDDAMSFCDVGLCWGHGDEEDDEYGDDDWYLVGGQML